MTLTQEDKLNLGNYAIIRLAQPGLEMLDQLPAKLLFGDSRENCTNKILICMLIDTIVVGRSKVYLNPFGRICQIMQA